MPDFEGQGEQAPQPYFYQNLGEAEYMVTVYQYMRLLGYPAKKISMLTTYNGQLALLRDIVEAKCANNPLFGRPHRVRHWCLAIHGCTSHGQCKTTAFAVRTCVRQDVWCGGCACRQILYVPQHSMRSVLAWRHALAGLLYN